MPMILKTSVNVKITFVVTTDKTRRAVSIARVPWDSS